MLARLTSGVLESKNGKLGVTQVRELPDHASVEVRWGVRAVSYTVSDVAKLKAHCESHGIRFIPSGFGTQQPKTTPRQRQDAALQKYVERYIAPATAAAVPAPQMQPQFESGEWESGGVPESWDPTTFETLPAATPVVHKTPPAAATEKLAEKATISRFVMLATEYARTHSVSDARAAATQLRALAKDENFVPKSILRLEWRDSEDKRPHTILMLIPIESEAEYAASLLNAAQRGDWSVEVEVADKNKRLVRLSAINVKKA